MRKQFLYLAVLFPLTQAPASTAAIGLLESTDAYMADRPARISEIYKLCTKHTASSMGGPEHKRLLLSMCAFDTGHTTGFNATTQAQGKVVDLAKVQSTTYTMKLMGALSGETKKCQAETGRRSVDDGVLYCVALRGYSSGKRYGKRYLRGQEM